MNSLRARRRARELRAWACSLIFAAVFGLGIAGGIAIAVGLLDAGAP